MTPVLIESTSEMEALAAQLEKETIIAVDTEFQRETSYYPHIALIQIATDSVVACIDPLAFNAKPALQKILLNPQVTKIFHSCSQDMEVLYYYLGEVPAPVYDTQIANALLSVHHQIGYANLVESELNTQLDKSQTRTNWLQRPLTDKQIEYAGDDVYYLYKLHALLDKKLADTGRVDWFIEDSLNMSCKDSNFQVDIKNLWRRVKGANKLGRNKLAMVQAIAEWREQLAQDNDRTRRKILPDDNLIQIALKPAHDSNSLNKLIDHRYHFNAAEKQKLLDDIAAASQLPEDLWPDNRFSVLDGEQKKLLKKMQQIVNQQAEHLGISSATISSKKELEKMVISLMPAGTDADSEIADYTQLKLNVLQGWRFENAGQHLLEAITDNIKNSK